ncbi:hypothetical protein E2C01_029575 [Portunus trituberculatus]|uniref:Uncharacterized protein n=1 Tax=Portunus trituberculatus TaxID=210409 RepID=A0A5B7ES97_PORTR|nr:hypothetical protein [Portunus trituberculatus]
MGFNHRGVAGKEDSMTGSCTLSPALYETHTDTYPYPTVPRCLTCLSVGSSVRHGRKTEVPSCAVRLVRLLSSTSVTTTVGCCCSRAAVEAPECGGTAE